MRTKAVLLGTMLISIAALTGCGNDNTQIADGFQSSSKSSPCLCIPADKRFIAGKSVEGRDIECIIKGKGSDVTLFIASIHGSERAGTPLMRELDSYLNRPENRKLLADHKIIILPKINPDGFEHKTRYNANGIDLNRNFPAQNRENNKINGFAPLTEPESWIIYNIINEYKPDRILVFHEALNCIDFDGPADELARYLADRCDLPFNKVGARPGSLGSYAGVQKDIPIITVEFSKEARTLNQAQMWQRYSDMVLAAITFNNRS